MSADDLEADYRKRHPSAAAPAAPVPNAAVAPQQTTGDPLEDAYRKRHPPPAPTQAELQDLNPWEIPAGVSAKDYWIAKAHKAGTELGSAAMNTAKAIGDDFTLGFGTEALAAARGADPQSYRDEAARAKNELGVGGHYGLEAMSWLWNPARYLHAGAAAEKLAQKGLTKATQFAPETVEKVAKRVGDFIEGGTYGLASDVGHGERDPVQLGINTTASGALAAGGGAILDAAKAAGPWLRSKWGGFQGRPLTPGTPEGTPAEIRAAQPTAQDMANADALALWRSQATNNVPLKPSVSDYAERFYGPDPAAWPEGLRNLNRDVGKTGPSLPMQILGHGVTQAGAATANYLGLGLSPEIANSLYPVTAIATQKVLPLLKHDPNARAISNAYPALTGWRPELTMPDWRL